MNEEQQYRTGRFPEAEQVPAWVVDAVTAILDDDDAPDALIRTQRERMQQMYADDSALDAARRLLGVDARTQSAGLLAITEACIAADPSCEAQCWDAMWIVRRASGVESEYLLHLEQYARLLELRQQGRDEGWPDAWDARLCRLWREAGGTAATASAWTRRGWTAADALTASVTKAGHPHPMAQRVRDLNPPLCATTARARETSSSNVINSNAPARGTR